MFHNHDFQCHYLVDMVVPQEQQPKEEDEMPSKEAGGEFLLKYVDKYRTMIESLSKLSKIMTEKGPGKTLNLSGKYDSRIARN